MKRFLKAAGLTTFIIGVFILIIASIVGIFYMLFSQFGIYIGILSIAITLFWLALFVSIYNQLEE